MAAENMQRFLWERAPCMNGGGVESSGGVMEIQGADVMV